MLASLWNLPIRTGRGELPGETEMSFITGEVSFLIVRCLERDQTML